MTNKNESEYREIVCKLICLFHVNYREKQIYIQICRKQTFVQFFLVIRLKK
jgi:hypothetical protein